MSQRCERVGRMGVLAGLALAFSTPGSAQVGAQVGAAAPMEDARGLDGFDWRDGERRVMARVHLRTARDLAAVGAMADTFWSCRIGVGPMDVQLPESALAALDAMGLAYEVRITDVERLIEMERRAIDELARLRGLDWYENYKTYDEIIAYTNDLVARFGPAGTENPGMLTREVIGQSIEGRDIVALRVNAPGATPGAKPALLFNGGQHAREWVSPPATMYIAERFLDGYGTHPRVTALLDDLEFLFVPLVNPDGYAYSWINSSTRLWRKNRRNNGNGTFGVDLNRNWDIIFGGPGASNIPSSDIYHGPSAFSEPETAAIRDYFNAQSLVVGHIDFHSFSQLILWPWGYGFVSAPEPDNQFFIDLGFDMAQAISSAGGVGYTPQQSVDLYPATGTCSDWFYDQGVYSYTFELRDTGFFGFVLPPEQILPTAAENFEAVLVMGERLASPIAITQTFTPPLTVAPATPIGLGFDAVPVYGTLDPAASTLYYRLNGGAWNTTPLSGGPFTFGGTIPGQDCGALVEYYAQFQTTDARVVTLPKNTAQPFAISVEETELAVFDDMETDTGWIAGLPGDTATTGQWERGVPVFTGAQPGSDHTPAPGVNCWITGASGTSLGSNDVDGGFTTLISPALDCDPANAALAGAEAYIRYWRWYSNNAGANPNTDVMQISISNDDGASWVPLESVTENAEAWVERVFRVSDYVAPTAQVRLRFVAEDAEPGSIVEAAVDDLEVFFAGCADVFAEADLTTSGTTNGEPDGVVDLSDFSFYLGLWSSEDPAADLTATGTTNGVPDMTVDLSDFSYYLGLWSTQSGG